MCVFCDSDLKFVCAEAFCNSGTVFRRHSASAIDWEGYSSALLCLLVLQGTTSEGAPRSRGMVTNVGKSGFREILTVYLYRVSGAF